MPGYIMDLRKLVGHRTLMQCAASIIIVNEKNQILLGKRTDNHKWGYAGGSIELDEKVEDCVLLAFRIVHLLYHEETGKGCEIIPAYIIYEREARLTNQAGFSFFINYRRRIRKQEHSYQSVFRGIWPGESCLFPNNV